MNRREFLKSAALAATAASLPSLVRSQTGQEAPDEKAKSNAPAIALLVYPEFTALDLIGPYQFLCALTDHRVLLVSKRKGVITSDTGVGIRTDTSFRDCPKDLAAILVPGGTVGTLNAMKDKATLDFVRDRGSRAKYVTSVCTGSLVLAAAGLLDGKRATGHWLVRDLLKRFGAEPVDERVVKDGNRITGAGVSAGLDLGLALVNEIAGEEYARQCQLWFEYDPQPMFDSGSPAKSKKEDVAMLSAMATEFRLGIQDFAKKQK